MGGLTSRYCCWAPSATLLSIDRATIEGSDLRSADVVDDAADIGRRATDEARAMEAAARRRTIHDKSMWRKSTRAPNGLLVSKTEMSAVSSSFVIV